MRSVRTLLCAITGLLPASSLAATFDIAHLREQNQNMIVIPLDDSFDFKSERDQQRTAYALQECASAARLAGDVVLVWSHGRNMKFMAPGPWQSFFRERDMLWVAKNINKTLTCR